MRLNVTVVEAIAWLVSYSMKRRVLVCYAVAGNACTWRHMCAGLHFTRNEIVLCKVVSNHDLVEFCDVNVFG